VRPGGVGLKLDGVAQMLDGLGILLPSQRRSQDKLRQIHFPAAANSGCRRAAAFSGFPSFNSASADKTRLAVAIPPFGQFPCGRVPGAADFCKPTYPNDAASAFRRSQFRHIGAESLKRRSNASSARR